MWWIIILFLCFSQFIGLGTSYNALDDILVPESSIGRNLLQNKKACPVNFEIQNYTIITSQCKGPEYPPKQCCDALVQFACPYADDVNDGSNDCAETMFSYINLYGKYPPGLFASECKGDKQGLKCPDSSPQRSGQHVLALPLPLTLTTILVVTFLA